MITMSTTTEPQEQILADAEAAGFGDFHAQDIRGKEIEPAAPAPEPAAPATPEPTPGEPAGTPAPAEGTAEGATAAASEPAGEAHEENAEGTGPDKLAKAHKKTLKQLDKRTKDWRTEESRRQQLEQENEELRRQLAAKPEPPKAAEPAPPAEPAAAQPAEVKEPVPPVRPKRADFQYDDDAYEAALEEHDRKMIAYQTELANHVANQRLAERDRQDQERAQQEHFRNLADNIRAKHPDFDEVKAAVSGENDPVFSPEVTSLIAVSDVADELIYHLAKNPEDAKYIAGLPPVIAARELGRLEAFIEDQQGAGGGNPAPPAAAAPVPAAAPAAPRPAATAPAAQPPAAARATTPSRISRPAPINPVNTGAAVTATVSDPGNLSPREYRAWREANRAKK